MLVQTLKALESRNELFLTSRKKLIYSFLVIRYKSNGIGFEVRLGFVKCSSSLPLPQGIHSEALSGFVKLQMVPNGPFIFCVFSCAYSAMVKFNL